MKTHFHNSMKFIVIVLLYQTAFQTANSIGRWSCRRNHLFPPCFPVSTICENNYRVVSSLGLVNLDSTLKVGVKYGPVLMDVMVMVSFLLFSYGIPLFLSSLPLSPTHSILLQTAFLPSSALWWEKTSPFHFLPMGIRSTLPLRIALRRREVERYRFLLVCSL